jgi:hypothetical protein
MMEARTDEYLLDRHKAAQRYGMSVRALEEMYKRHPDFPIIRRGKRVMIHRPKADAWFDEYVGSEIDMD